MFNQIILIGRLTKDIEVRYTEDERAIGNFTVAVPRPFKNVNGEKESDFIDCVIFKEAAENMAKYVHKGDMVSVKGRLQKRSYEDKEGNKKYITEVVTEKIGFLQVNKKDETEKEEVKEENPFADMKEKVEADQSIEISDEDLPF